MSRPIVTHELNFEGDQRDKALRLEWLLSNGAGSFAMGSVAGINTRRYHGLLIASAHPPVDRVMALNQVVEVLTLRRGDSTQKLNLTGLMFHGEQGPFIGGDGPKLLRRFTRGLTVAWEYDWGDLTVRRELALHWKEPTAELTWHFTGLSSVCDEATLSLSPMLTLRDFHSITRKPGGSDQFKCDVGIEDVIVQLDGRSVAMVAPGSKFKRGRDWWYNLHYPADAERGQESSEDHFIPGAFEWTLNGDNPSRSLLVSLGDRVPTAKPDPTADRREHLEPMLQVLDAVQPADHAGHVRRTLALAADDFVVDRTVSGQKLSTIMAGYPWFSDWGRDTFIALPGLLLSTGRYDEARDTLAAFARAIRRGLVPNRFDDYKDDAAHYNTVDASLWFVQAAMAYLHASDDRASWNDWLRQAVLDVMEAYIRGTDYDIRMAGDGLITAGNPGTQLTWMDAACGGTVFTPRHGKAVEINALWYDALVRLATLLKGDDKRTADHFNKLAKRVKRGFAKVFWSDDLGCCVDHVWTDEDNVDHPDLTIRPNQVFVCSLPESPLPRTKQQQMLNVVKQKLLTPFGLRTLPPEDPSYHPHYCGDQYKRDEAYHQGTIWPWLIGPYAEAVLRGGKFDDKARREARAAIQPLLNQLMGDGLGQLHEIHEAAAPHRPVGCIAQAWSVSEVLRVLRMIEGE